MTATTDPMIWHTCAKFPAGHAIPAITHRGAVTAVCPFSHQRITVEPCRICGDAVPAGVDPMNHDVWEVRCPRHGAQRSLL